MSILIATHNFAEAVEVCDGVAVLQKGSLIATSRARSLSDRQLREFYLTLIGEQDLIAWNEEVPA
jgi:ABC-type multidrug transport system ATPase subunit